MSRKLENAHIALWLVKDACWVATLRVPALLLAGPTLSLSLYMAWRMRRDVTEFSHNLAVSLWIAGNIVWMIGEFFFDDAWRPAAMVFFGAGLALMAWYYGRLAWRMVVKTKPPRQEQPTEAVLELAE